MEPRRAFVVRTVAAADTRPLRQRVLRPHQRAEELVFEGDDAPDARHFAAFTLDSREVVAVGSVHPQPAPGSSSARDWRLRGMATASEMRGAGCGTAIVRACIGHVRAMGGMLLWCNARVGAVAFYERLGFRKEGPEFELPGIGAHFVMVTRVGELAGPTLE